jgi:hypothetical protein
LKVYADSVTDPTLHTFAETPAGLMALNMARSIVSRSGQPISRRDALALAETYVGRMHKGNLRDLRRDNTISLICLDNARHLGRPARLYDLGSERVRPSRDLADVIQGCLVALSVSEPRLRDAQHVVQPAASIRNCSPPLVRRVWALGWGGSRPGWPGGLICLAAVLWR